MAAATVEDYLAELPTDQRRALERLRKLIRDTVPEAEEKIAYGIPLFYYRGKHLVGYAAFKSHCSLLVITGAARWKYAQEIEPYLSGKSTLRFAPEKPIPDGLVKKLVRSRAAENEASVK